ncbi:hypothetical protein AB0M95_37805 [Sphaerisporangium sp. NPDC051017]|uniref:hypothetical protein n=1 Tax=Sphaerisporangium sp. NPDC051017 TaxID=3154636 RepID=UPI00343C69E1
MKPLIYGYMRVRDDAGDEEIRRTELELTGFAEVEGFHLAAIFYEFVPGYHGAFHKLIKELKRADAHHVVVPSLRHFSGHSILRDVMVTQLELEADAEIWTVEP